MLVFGLINGTNQVAKYPIESNPGQYNQGGARYHDNQYKNYGEQDNRGGGGGGGGYQPRNNQSRYVIIVPTFPLCCRRSES